MVSASEQALGLPAFAWDKRGLIADAAGATVTLDGDAQGRADSYCCDVECGDVVDGDGIGHG